MAWALFATIVFLAAGVGCIVMIHRHWLNDLLHSKLGITIKEHSHIFDVIVWSELGLVALFTFFLVRRIDAHICHSNFVIPARRHDDIP